MKTQKIDLASTAGQKWTFKPEDRNEWGSIDVPAGGWRKQGRHCNSGSYRLSFTTPEYARGSVLRVAFAAVNFGARVSIGRDEASLVDIGGHVGGWMPFAVDISKHVEPASTYLLHVDVDGREWFKVDGKYIVPEAAAWQVDLADGILRGIELEIFPAVFVEDVQVRTSVDDDSLKVEATVVNRTAEPVKAVVKCLLDSATPARSFGYPRLPNLTITLAPGETRRVAFDKTIWGLGPESFWWPNVPYRQGHRAVLHRAVVSVHAEGHAHELTQRFGFREFKTIGAAYYLNDVRCNLRGDNQQEANFGTDAYGTFPGFGPPVAGNAGWPGAVDNLLRVNFNVLRIHQVPCTPYMLDICDEMGLMIVDETPVRGSEHKENFVAGWDNMLRAARELALRDRNHPSIVLWSAANEIWGERALALALQGAIYAVDDTRPIIIDGVEDLGHEIINMEHYVGGLGVLPEQGGTPRYDRPFGETESVWPADNSRRGFTWMSTATRIRRLKNNADIRNYVLNNCWSNYVPGQGPDLQVLEKKVKDIRWEWVVEKGMDIQPPLDDPWSDPLIKLMQQSFHPYAVFDLDFDEKNKHSDADGTWPLVLPELKGGETATRRLAIFNDSFDDVENFDVTFELRAGDPTGKFLERGEIKLRVPMGEYRRRAIAFPVPTGVERVALVLRLYRNDVLLFEEDKVAFRVS